ncbi:hypothetical protein EI42_06206 [Thermosporothrix hazakensis]|jgi:hypothetical protein|uniref:Uncharacterized protein n=2 Tax=Thermosporothrix TaxID=768650 RepID=A0A326TSZ6_THEHA|nr:hypothetical protein [Thermosporothrix hazakensis]PZW18331.1 hypothetical protein EI42_06206 [Thermosporothrix hazakensis]BBH90388.1 hypothetical protein KTC_51390 [Thermosporothrix sp. COM3]GCE48426.1 hypothetical protein KTH_32950 [Thermosporothrix hazakensis]
MTQEYKVSTRRRKAKRQRAVIVTSPEGVLHSVEPTPEESTSAAEESHAVAVQTLEADTVEESPAPSRRRLPGFFSKVGKSQETQPEEIARARLARASRNKAQKHEGKDTKEEETKAEKPKSPSKPAPLFKTRWILGLLIYMLVANVLSYGVITLTNALGWERILLEHLFGLPLRITTSSLIFIIALIVLLVVLVKFDLLPRFNTTSNTNRGKKPSSSKESSTPRVQPTIKQGEKGADDDLYIQYRLQQRKEKRR